MPPSSEHEARHRIFQHDERLFARSLTNILGIPVPEPFDVSVLSIDLTETRPMERRADTVLRARFIDGDSVSQYILIVESQTDDEETRRRRWPYYIAFLQDKYECPVALLVTCSKEETARWAREPIRIGLPGWTCMTVTPMVLGPDNVPAVTTVAQASADVPAAVFSALTHSRGSQARGILEALAFALDTIDTETAAFLAEFTDVGLGDTVGRQIWKVLMATVTYSYASGLRSQFRAEGEAKGRAEGEAKGRALGEAGAILRVLDRRGIAVDADSRQRIESCRDLEILDAWLDRSLTATKASDLFG